MVTRETSYIGQLYFGLSTDDPADVAEWHNGDRILLMDLDQMYVYDEASSGFKQISMGGGGGGGGGGSTIVSKTITANGTYYASSDSADGYDPVVVNVPSLSTENFVFKLRNEMGANISFVSAFYDPEWGGITTYIYASQSNNTEVQKTVIKTGNKVQMGWVTSRDLTNITYNGNPVTFTTSGSGMRRYVEFTIPENFDFTIPIVFIYT